jgi:hypothetical protein
MKRRFPTWPLLAISALAQADATQTGVVFSHKDWDLVCREADTCTAMGYSPGDGIDAVSVALLRDAGPGTAFLGLVRFANLGGALPSTPVKLLVEDRSLGEVAKDHLPGDFTLEARQSRALVNALRGDPDIRFVDAHGRAWPLSSSGATAVLLKMDEYQARLGTPGAALRQGEETEGLVPRQHPPTPPIQHPLLAEPRPEDALLADAPALRQALLDALPTDDSCPDLRSAHTPKPLQIQRLDDHRVLVSTQCRIDRYNSLTGYWVSEDRPPYLSSLVTASGTHFYRRDAQLRAWLKQTPQGYCMTNTYWTWDGIRFVMTYNTAHFPCSGFKHGAWDVPGYLR